MAVRVAGRAPDMDAVCRFVTDTFAGAELRECHQSVAQFQLPAATGLRFSEVFGHLEAARQRLDIEDYSVSQTTLDQVRRGKETKNCEVKKWFIREDMITTVDDDESDDDGDDGDGDDSDDNDTQSISCVLVRTHSIRWGALPFL